MTTTLAFTHLAANDVDEALTFYCDALGFSVLNDVSAGGGRWVTVGAEAQPGVTIVLSAPSAGRSPDEGDAMQKLLVKGALPMIGFSTDDVDGLFDKVSARGFEVLQEPTDQPWGPRDCAFRDPSGNTVRITAQADV